MWRTSNVFLALALACAYARQRLVRGNPQVTRTVGPVTGLPKRIRV